MLKEATSVVDFAAYTGVIAVFLGLVYSLFSPYEISPVISGFMGVIVGFIVKIILDLNKGKKILADENKNNEKKTKEMEIDELE